MSILDSKVFYDLAKVSGLVISEVNDKTIELTSNQNPIQFCKECSKTLKVMVKSQRDGNSFRVILPAII